MTIVLLLLFLSFHQALLGVMDPALSTPTEHVAGNDAETTASGTIVTADDLAYRRLANALPLFALSMLLLGLTRRPLLSLWVTMLCAGALYTVDQLKHQHLQAHLLPADASLLPQIVDSPQLYLLYMVQGGVGPLLLLGILLTTLAFCLEPAQRWLRPLMRIVLVACGLLAIYAIATGRPIADRWYENERLGFTPWTPDASIERAGLIAGLVKLADETLWQVPDPDPAFVAHVLALHPEPTAAAMAPSDQPDIIVWQSESLFDPSRLSNIAAGLHTPRLMKLRKHSLHGDMLVPTYGGGTVRTEFEAMTGYPMRAFAGINYPYSALAQKPLMSLPRQLRDHGYETVAIHPYDAGFWSRDRAFVQMGFDRFEDDRHFDQGERHGWYIGDDALLRRVQATLAEPRESPLFLFAISMENHGPWNERPGLDEATLAKIELPAGVGAEVGEPLRRYLYHLHRADRFLGELIELVGRRERHTLVLFYGDHLPGLDAAFRQIGFRDGESGPHQPVPFALYDNRKPLDGPAGGTLRSYHLASLVLDAAGFRDNPHFRVVSADRERQGATGLIDVVPNPALDYDHALGHLSWYFYQHGPQPVPEPATLAHAAETD